MTERNAVGEAIAREWRGFIEPLLPVGENLVTNVREPDDRFRAVISTRRAIAAQVVNRIRKNKGRKIMTNLSTCESFVGAEEAVHDAARAATGLVDFGDASYRDNLRAYLHALDASDKITPIGREIILGNITGYLCSRLFLQDQLKKHAHVLQRPIVAPIFVLGLPRTGTTLLQNLLAADPASQALQLWLTQQPQPRPPKSTWPSYPAFQNAKAGLDALYAAMPEMKSIHWMAADEPDECRAIFWHTFANASLGWPNDLDMYLQWLYQHDMTPEYRYLANALRLIGGNEPEKTWVLKCPTHSLCVDKLLDVFPDARLILLHRDPADVVASITSMVYKLRCMTEGENTRPERCGEQMLNNLDYAMRCMLRVRERQPENFLDVRYRDFIADPIAGMRRIYARFDLNFTANAEAGMRQWLQDNPPGKHGSHRYAPEDFGLTREKIHQTFAYYSDY